MEQIIIKTEEQIEGIRKACKLAADTLRFIEPHVVPGVSTNHLNSLIETYTKDHGAIPAPLGYQGYPKATCISLNEVICHGVPGEDVLKEGDILNIDVTPILDGYYGDTSKMFSVGEVNDSAKKIMKAAEKALEIGIKQVHPGVRFGMIGYAISRLIDMLGYSIVDQFCGHGTGVDFHEPPQVNHRDWYDRGEFMKTGMIFTIEPMINEGVKEAVIDRTDKWTARTKDGKLSAQYEHTVLVTKDGVEILTE